jgi:hypothetical protein
MRFLSFVHFLLSLFLFFRIYFFSIISLYVFARIPLTSNRLRFSSSSIKTATATKTFQKLRQPAQVFGLLKNSQ